MMAAPVAFATSVDWMGLTWNISGASNSAVVDGNGYLAITVLGGNSGDPGTDNWAVYAKPTGAIKWYEFTFTDPGGTTIYSPRAYASANLPSGGEMCMHGGALAPWYTPTYTNMHVWDPLTDDEDWSFGNWTKVYNNRPAGDHTFKVGLGSNGEVDFFYDGNLKATYRIGQYYPVWNGSAYEDVQFTWKAPNLNIAYLGVDTAVDTNATIIYKDFQWGTSYTPVPLPSTVLLLGSGLAGLAFYRKRRAIVGKG